MAPQPWHGTTPTGHPQRSSDPRSYVAIAVRAGQGLAEYIHRNLHRLGGIDVDQEFQGGWSNESLRSGYEQEMDSHGHLSYISKA